MPIISKFYGIIIKCIPSRANTILRIEKWDVFKTLSSVKGLFEQVKVDAGGYGISQNDDTDLSCNELWENGMPIGAATADGLRAIQAAHEEYARGETMSHNEINRD